MPDNPVAFMTDSVFLTKICVALFVTTSLLHAGLVLTVAQVRAPLRSRWLLVGALIGNFVLVPVAALVIARLFRLSDGLSLGLLLVGMSAGAPFLPRLVELAQGSAALAVAVMTLLLVTTVVYLPLVLPHFAPGVAVQPWAIARPVVLLMLAPLAAGMAIRAWNPSFAGRLGPPLKGISRVAMLVLLVLLVAVNFERVRSVVGSGALIAAGLLILAAIGIGFVTGGTSPERRRVLALGTGQRGISAALLIATHVAQDPDAAVMVVVVILVGELILFSSAAGVGRWAKKTP
jgi:bile acid:Na+ symporter, BASS family